MSDISTEIPANSPYDISQRGATSDTLSRFKGVDRQLVIDVTDNHRPVIMDGQTIGGKSKIALENQPNNFTGEQTLTNRTEEDISSVPGNALLNKYDIMRLLVDSSEGNFNQEVFTVTDESQIDVSVDGLYLVLESTTT